MSGKLLIQRMRSAGSNIARTAADHAWIFHLGLALLVMLALLYACASRFWPITVWTRPIVEQMSPGGAWIALVDETVHEGGPLTAIVASVRLKSTRDNTGSVAVIHVDTGGHHEDRPRISWLNATTLRVLVNDTTWVTIERRHYQDVGIDVVIDPVDAHVRH